MHSPNQLVNILDVTEAIIKLVEHPSLMREPLDSDLGKLIFEVRSLAFQVEEAHQEELNFQATNMEDGPPF
jgi:hypothetical protein